MKTSKLLTKPLRGAEIAILLILVAGAVIWLLVSVFLDIWFGGYPEVKFGGSR